jgi:hypothetical protein
MTDFSKANANGENADCCPDHGSWRSEGPVWIQISKLVQLVQENGGVKFAIAPVPESLHCLVDLIFVPMMKQFLDFSGPIHGLDFDLDGLSDLSAEMTWSMVRT